MKAKEMNRLRGVPDVSQDSREYLEYLLNLPQVPVPYDTSLMNAKFYVNGTRIRFHIDGSEAIVLTSYYCLNHIGAELALGLSHVIRYRDPDDDGVSRNEVWGASMLYRATQAFAFPATWERQFRERLEKRDFLRNKYGIVPPKTRTTNNANDFTRQIEVDFDDYNYW